MAGYGTTSSRPANGHATTATQSDDSDAERQPLLGKSPSGPGLSKLRRNLNAELSRSWADLMLLFCYVVTGLLDSASTQVWGAFVSMQTGKYKKSRCTPKASFSCCLYKSRNTVYVALGIASLVYPPISPRLYRSGISLLSFCVGSFFFARFHRFFSPKRRWVICASFTAQLLLTVAAALIVTFNPAPESDDSVDWTVLLPLALVAFQSCGQAVTSRALKYNALTSVVLTSIYCDLFSDPDLFKLHNVERNRRAAAPLLLLAGAVLGGLFSHSPVGIQGALWTAAALKLVMVVMWFLWPEEPTEEE